MLFELVSKRLERHRKLVILRQGIDNTAAAFAKSSHACSRVYTFTGKPVRETPELLAIVEAIGEDAGGATRIIYHAEQPIPGTDKFSIMIDYLSDTPLNPEVRD